MTTTAVQRKSPAGALAPIASDTQTRLSTATSSALAAFNAPPDQNGVIAALNVAQGVAELRELFDLPEIKERIIALQDKAIGFRTDKDPTRKQRGKDGSEYYPTPYSYDIVRDCAIEATLRGLQLVGNQMNIISGRMYATREGYEGLIRKLKVVTDFTPIIHVPRAAQGGNGVLIECEATWLHDGKPQAIKATIPVKTDNYSTIEQSLGKATRKFLKRCYEKMTGNAPSDGDAGDALEVETQVETTPTASQPAPAPDFSSRARKPKQEPTPQPAPEPAPVPPPAEDPSQTISPLQFDFAKFCEESGVDFDDAMGWMKTTGRWPQSDSAESFSDVPDSVLEKLASAPNDMARLVKLFGNAGGR